MNGVRYAVNHVIREVLVIRARGGSKTHDMMCVCLYFGYIGYRVIYFCSTASQMEQPKKYLKTIVEGSFLKYCVKKPHREYFQKTAVYFELGGYIEIKNLTDDNARSPRCDVVLFDEEAKAEKDAFMAAESILEGSDLALTIHSSTPIKGTIFEENYDRLITKEIVRHDVCVFSRKWTEIGFLSQYPERYAEKEAKQPGWFFRQENLCSFELPSGAVFKNVVYEPYTPELLASIKDSYECNGLDWNPAAGHFIGGGKWTLDMKGFVITDITNLGSGYVAELTKEQYRAIVMRGTHGSHLNIEEGGINEEYVKWFRKLKATLNYPNQNFHYEEWDNQGKAKYKIVTFIIQNGITIYIDKIRFPDAAKQVQNCHWDEDTKGRIPQIAKDKANSPHILDLILHAMSSNNRTDTRFSFGDWY